MTTKVDDDRLEKERAAVLSEASMVNKMEYRLVGVGWASRGVICMCTCIIYMYIMCAVDDS